MTPERLSRLSYWFYSSRAWAFLLRLTGRVPAGYYVRRDAWMTLEDAQRCVGPGWAGLIERGFNRCLKHGWRIHQIKEKFGGLRFYCDAGFEMDDIEGESYAICEECGKPGEPRAGGWVKTLCDECAKPEARLRRRERNWQ